jgi:hypothetical protein
MSDLAKMIDRMSRAMRHAVLANSFSSSPGLSGEQMSHVRHFSMSHVPVPFFLNEEVKPAISVGYVVGAEGLEPSTR